MSDHFRISNGDHGSAGEAAAVHVVDRDVVLRPVTLREWFVGNYCDDASVNQLLAVQSCTCGGRESTLTRYFHFISDLGSGTFYVLVIPLFVWSGYEHEGIYLCFLLSLGLYITDVLKDTFACPRPPVPPVRRGGSASHAQEYGWPSTHTALASIMAWQCTRFLASHDSGNAWLYAAVGITYVIQISVSRMYLGLHWVADVVGGFAIFVLLALVDAAFLRVLMEEVFSQYRAWPYFFVFLVGHLAVMFHATPRDPCPCFEDSVRFIGVDVGAIIGLWCRKRHVIAAAGMQLKSTSPAGAFFGLLFTKEFAIRYVVGIVLVLLSDIAFSFLTKRMFPGVFRVLSGSLGNLGKLQPVYAFVCCLVGAALGKELLVGKTTNWADTMDKQKVEGSGSSSSAAVTVQSVGSDSPASTAPATVLVADASSAAATGRYWSLRNHNHWWEADIQAKLFAYAAIGFSVTCGAPVLFELFEMS